MSHRSPVDQQDLIARLAGGEAAALAPLFAMHAASVRRLAMAITRDEAASDEIVQETFVRVMEAAGTFDPTRGEPRAWLLAIARNLARAERRAPREIPSGDDEEPLSHLAVDAGWGATSPERLVSGAEDAERIARALASLSSSDREVLVLRDLDDLAPEDLARVLDVPVASAKSRLHRARLRLLAALRSEEAGVSASERTVGGMTCSEVLAHLSDFVDGALGPTDEARVRAHLVGCTVCERFGGRYAGAVSALRGELGAAPAVDARVLDDLMVRLGARGER